MNRPHLPALRLGRAYESLEKVEVRDHRNGEPVAAVSQVNAGIIRRDLDRIETSRVALKKFTCAQLIEMSSHAADVFMNNTLPLGDKGDTQSPQQYIETLSDTSGLPHALVRRNMNRISTVLSQMETILRGLTRGLDLSIIDKGFGEQGGIAVSYFATTNSLGVIMPSNSPAVNSLWLPAIALKVPVVLKPGREEPFTPWRLIQSFLAAGVPAEAFGFYPTDHEGAGEILRLCGRVQLFGDKTITDRYAGDPRIEIHGPGYSKILIGSDEIGHWPAYLDHGGFDRAKWRPQLSQSSAIVVPALTKSSLAERLGPVRPKAIDDGAVLAGFTNEDGRVYRRGDRRRSANLRRRKGDGEVSKGAATGQSSMARFTCDRQSSAATLCAPLAVRDALFPVPVSSVPQTKIAESIGPSWS
jgi:hypothetical protein